VPMFQSLRFLADSPTTGNDANLISLPIQST
jgi:hypothetical protein